MLVTSGDSAPQGTRGSGIMPQLPGDIKAAAKICTRTCTRSPNPALQKR
jgi:hypothetical protein